MRIFNFVGNFFLKSKARLFVLIMVVVVLFWFFFFGSPRKETKQNVGVPSPAGIDIKRFGENKNALISKLPYEGDGFSVEYFPDQDYFYIKVKKGPYSTYKENAEGWLMVGGIDLNLVTIQWGSVRGIEP